MQAQYDEVELKSAPLADSARTLSWQERRQGLYARLQQQPLPGIGNEEVEAHFATMPSHYWEQVSWEDLAWGLETIHGFYQFLGAPNLSAAKPFLSWRPLPSSNRTQVMLCTWDRQGLLAKAAAAFSAVNLNIHQADVFTRADNLVLDLFCITDAHTQGLANTERLSEMGFLLEGALSDPPRFASVWACSRHKVLVPPDPFAPRISFDNPASGDSTLIHIEACDRLGLLYDILHALAEAQLNVTQARIETCEEIAHDSIYVKDVRGHPVRDTSQLEALRLQLETALTVRQ